MIKQLREPVNSITHYFGAILFFIGTILMYIRAFKIGMDLKRFISVTAFGLSLITLYTTSGYFHSIHGSSERIEKWNKVDHTMIFVLIAGSYTPFCLLGLPGKSGIILLSIVWGIAIIGCLLMFIRERIPSWINTILYIALGWAGISQIISFYINLPRPAFYLLVLGGIFYTIGGVIFEIQKPVISKYFGSHEIFHIFVILGSLSHFLAVYLYLL